MKYGCDCDVIQINFGKGSCVPGGDDNLSEGHIYIKFKKDRWHFIITEMTIILQFFKFDNHV